MERGVDLKKKKEEEGENLKLRISVFSPKQHSHNGLTSIFLNALGTVNLQF